MLLPNLLSGQAADAAVWAEVVEPASQRRAHSASVRMSREPSFEKVSEEPLEPGFVVPGQPASALDCMAMLRKKALALHDQFKLGHASPFRSSLRPQP